MMGLISKLFRSLSYRLTKSSWKRLAIENVYEGYHGNWVELKEIGLVLKEGDLSFLLRGYQYAKNIKQRINGQFKIIDSSLYLIIEKIEIRLNSTEELFIVNEIYVNKCYEFHSGKESVVMDIGMNVGLASLYFASRDDVVKVYSYEPFKPTFDLAQINLALNNEIESKVKLLNVGLGDKDKTLEVNYSNDYKGQVGIHGIELVKSKVTEVLKEEIVIKNASNHLNNILLEHRGKAVIVKMDCEGAEFEIIPNWAENGLLNRVDLIMMEWHDQPEQLIVLLEKAGFKSIRVNHSENIGMIYAIQ